MEHSAVTTSYSDALVILGTAGVLIPIARKLGVSPVLGYLGAGALLGPLGLGAFVDHFPPLTWFTITDTQSISGWAQLGVVFLLFLIGLELSFQRLTTMRRLVLGMGGLQVVVTAVLIAAAAWFGGLQARPAIILGASLSLSSTAIVLELLSRQGRLSTSAGRASFAVLLAQDIAVVPILMFVSIAGGSSDASLAASLARAVIQTAAALTVIVALGRLLMRPLFRLVAGTYSSELFIAAVLFVIVGAGVIANQAGLSMALGAFVAGLLLAETEYGKAIQATAEPFKGLLLGIFFFTVGMNIDFRGLVREPVLLIGCVAALIFVKALIVTGLGKLFRMSWHSAIETGLLLGPGGEFAFVGLGTAAAVGAIDKDLSGFALAVTSITMALTPLLAMAGRKLCIVMTANKAPDPLLTARPAGGAGCAILVGYGRVGKVVSSLLKTNGVSFVAADHDPITVTRERREGGEVYFGDASDPEFLRVCGLMQASGVIITINAAEVIDAIVAEVRTLRPDILIVARAHDAAHARHLYEVGATDAVPETVEASLQLSEAALVGLGVPTGKAIASIHEKRDEFRSGFQHAAQEAGRDVSHAMRPKARQST